MLHRDIMCLLRFVNKTNQFFRRIIRAFYSIQRIATNIRDSDGHTHTHTHLLLNTN